MTIKWPLSAYQAPLYEPWSCADAVNAMYDLVDNGNGTLTLNCAVPGLRKEDLKLTQSGDTLKVETISKAPEGFKKTYRGIPDTFTYKFSIPGYRVEEAKCGDGILQILLSKNEATGVIPIK